MKLPMLLLGVVALMACGGTVEASRFDQACSQDSDCVAVYSGPLCGVCGACANDAINVSAKAKYDADVKAVACPPRVGPQPACSPCQQPVALCTANVCVLKPG